MSFQTILQNNRNSFSHQRQSFKKSYKQLCEKIITEIGEKEKESFPHEKDLYAYNNDLFKTPICNRLQGNKHSPSLSLHTPNKRNEKIENNYNFFSKHHKKSNLQLPRIHVTPRQLSPVTMERSQQNSQLDGNGKHISLEEVHKINVAKKMNNIFSEKQKALSESKSKFMKKNCSYIDYSLQILDQRDNEEFYSGYRNKSQHKHCILKVDNYYGDYVLKQFHPKNRKGQKIKTSIMNKLLPELNLDHSDIYDKTGHHNSILPPLSDYSPGKNDVLRRERRIASILKPKVKKEETKQFSLINDVLKKETINLIHQN